MRNELHFATGNNQVSTPLSAIEEFVKRYTGGRLFTTDVAAIAANAKAPKYFGPDHVDPARRNCLTIPWPTITEGELNYLNPPYSGPESACRHTITADGTRDYSLCVKKRCAKRGWHAAADIPGCIDFVAKAAQSMTTGNAETFALLAARTDTKWFHQYVWDHETSMWRPGVHGWFLPGRINFGQDAGAPFPSLLVRFSPQLFWEHQ